ncbi:hypothetical protein YC2023_077955 [Brassica napus]
MQIYGTSRMLSRNRDPETDVPKNILKSGYEPTKRGPIEREQWRLSSSRVLNGTLSKIRTDRRQEQVSDSRNIAKNHRERPLLPRFESTTHELGARLTLYNITTWG